jgi:thioredoxin 1
MPHSGTVLNVDDGDFPKEILKSRIPALVDFWASWCGACQIMAPVIEEIAKEYRGKIKFARLSVEENPQTPRQFGVRGIPTLILLKDGSVVDQIVGVVSKDRLRQTLDRAIQGR